MKNLNIVGGAQKVVILYFFQDLKQTEIARILNIGLTLVKYRIKKAKELLAKFLGKEDARCPLS